MLEMRDFDTIIKGVIFVSTDVIEYSYLDLTQTIPTLTRHEHDPPTQIAITRLNSLLCHTCNYIYLQLNTTLARLRAIKTIVQLLTQDSK